MYHTTNVIVNQLTLVPKLVAAMGIYDLYMWARGCIKCMYSLMVVWNELLYCFHADLLYQLEEHIYIYAEPNYV